MRIWPMYEWLSRGSKTRRANVFTGAGWSNVLTWTVVSPPLAQNYPAYFNIWITHFVGLPAARKSRSTPFARNCPTASDRSLEPASAPPLRPR
jgi:hypothetical protein